MPASLPSSINVTYVPTGMPTSVPTRRTRPNDIPTGVPTLRQNQSSMSSENDVYMRKLSVSYPSGQPTGQPSSLKSNNPTGLPTIQNTISSAPDPSKSPTIGLPTVAPTNAPTTFPVSLLQQQSVSEVQLVGLSFHYQQEIQVSLCLLTVLRCTVTHESFLSQRIIIGNATGGSFRLVLQGSYVSSSQVSIGSSASTVQNTLQAIAATIPSNLVTCYYFSVTKKTAKNYIAFDVTFLTDQPSPQTLLQVVGYGLQGESGVQ